MHRPRRRGLSAFEILAFFAFDAWVLVFLVPPMFPYWFHDGCGGGGPYIRTQQDLEVIKKAISLYDAREPAPLDGTSLDPLLGRYMQEIPRDPWGRDYVYDGDLGVVAGYGENGCLGGQESEGWDVLVRTRPNPGVSEEDLLEELARRRHLTCERGWLDPDQGWLRSPTTPP
jgi:hypothetical protein